MEHYIKNMKTSKNKLICAISDGTVKEYGYDELFTIERIREQWTKYKNAHGYRVLKGGKWKFYMRKPDLSGCPTRCEMVELHKHMNFPKYLEGL
uniref:Uncharacterized protein n=1 Tax=viral metagenome TaxID=1070528 RepID=A0A6M3L9R6_9ZZZZ